MLNEKTIESIRTVAGQNPTSEAVFKSLSDRKRFRYRTNLNKFRYNLLNDGQKIVDKEFIDIFKSLEIEGVGSLVHGRGKNPDRFIWNYNLKDVAKAISGNLPAGQVKELKQKRGPGRPVGSWKIKKVVNQMPEKVLTETKSEPIKSIKAMHSPMIRVTFDIPSTVDSKDLAALLSLVQDLKK